MKNEILKTILGFVGLMSLFLACGEGETLLGQLLWSGSWMLICLASMKGIEYLEKKEKKEQV